MKQLEGKWALVTGSSRGVGQKIALGLASEGCNIIVHARTKDAIHQTATLLKPTGVQVDSVSADMHKPGEIQAMIQHIIEKHGGVDILYNNAAVNSPAKSVYEVRTEHWAEVFQVNVFAVVQICAGLVPLMKRKHWGRVINLSSGIRGQPDFAPYSASKAALDKFTQDLAAELRGSGVLANYLDPGWLRTDMGGPNAPNPVDAVLPGALEPALLEDDGPIGQHFYALANK